MAGKANLATRRRRRRSFGIYSPPFGVDGMDDEGEPTNATAHAEAVDGDTVGYEQPADQRVADELELEADGTVGEQAREGQVHHRETRHGGKVIAAPQVTLGKFHGLPLRLWRFAKGATLPFLDLFKIGIQTASATKRGCLRLSRARFLRVSRGR